MTTPSPPRVRRVLGLAMPERDGPGAFALAAALTVVAVGARLLVEGLGLNMPFITFLPAVAAAAFLCGLRPTVALIFALALFAAVATPDGLARAAASAAVFCLAAAGVAMPAWHAARTQRALERRDDELVLVNQELKHRLKNLFAVVNSICQQTLRSRVPVALMGSVIEGRIHAVARAQDLLGVGPGTGSDLRALALAVLEPLRPDEGRLQIEGAPVELPSEATISLALILHELATNALKHGAWSGDEGRVVLAWQRHPEAGIRLNWSERDGPPVKPPEGEGFGSRVIRRALPNAVVDHVIAPEGARCTIELPA